MQLHTSVTAFFYHYSSISTTNVKKYFIDIGHSPIFEKEVKRYFLTNFYMKRVFLSLAFLLGSFAFSLAQDLTQLVDKVSPAIFKITTYDASGAELGVGTGFFISSSGNALTNYHVLQGASKAKVKTFDNKTYIIDNIIGWSQESDIVKFSVRNELSETFPFLKLNANAPKAGEKIFIVGNPLGLDKSVSDGIVSSIRQDDLYGETIQVTAPISQGNSGSPLMNMQGEALGIVTFFLKNGQNLNFAVSVKNLNIIEPVNALKFPPSDNQKVIVTTNNNNNEPKKNNTDNYNDPNSTFYYINSKVKFCTDLDGNQLPKNPGEVFYISPTGSWIYIWIGNDKKLATTQLIVDIYKKKNGEYDEFVETKYYDITSTWEDTHFKYTFYNTGDYKISVYTKENVWINSGYVTIKSNSENSSNSSTKTDDKYNDPSSTFYYMNSKVQFCLNLDANQFPINPGSSYNISKDGSWIYVHVQNDKKLATSQLIVDIYKKKGNDYTEFVETKYYDITPTWSDTHFKYTFYKAGDYKISVYTKENTWINSGYVTINYK